MRSAFYVQRSVDGRAYHSSRKRHKPDRESHQHHVMPHFWRRTMMNTKITALLLAGVLSAASVTTFAASNDSSGTSSGASSSATTSPNDSPATGSNGGASGSGAGTTGGTEPADGGTSAAGNGKGS